VFANNDPVNGSDPSGLNPETDCQVSESDACKIEGVHVTAADGDGNGGGVEITLIDGGTYIPDDPGWTLPDVPGGRSAGSPAIKPATPAALTNKAQKGAPHVRSACVAAGIAFGISAVTDASWLVGIGEAVAGARIGGRLVAFGQSAGGGALERVIQNTPRQRLNRLQYGAKLSGFEFGRLLRDGGLSIAAGDDSPAKTFLQSLVPIYGSIKAYQTMGQNCR
jgi:hypothetical protein